LRIDISKSDALLSAAETATLKLPEPLTGHPAAVYLGSLSQSRSAPCVLPQRDRLSADRWRIAFTLDWSKLRYRRGWRPHCPQAETAATTVNKMLVALRRVLLEAYRLDLLEMIDYSKATGFTQCQSVRRTARYQNWKSIL